MRFLNRGFSVVELLVSLCLLSILGGAAYRVLESQRRAYRNLVARSDMRQDLRTIAALLQLELEQLDATDTAGGDILAVTSSSITFRALRNTYFLCWPPEAGTGRVTIGVNEWLGSSPLDVTRQTLVLLAGGDSAANQDGWLHVGTASIEARGRCPSGAPSLTLALSNVTSAQLAGVVTGAPLQGFAVERLAAYRDASGDWWLGLQDAHDPDGRTWSEIQPLAGPLAPAGLQFSCFDSSGSVTSRTDDVARIQITIRVRTQELLSFTSQRSPEYGSAGLTLQVALRNNRRGP